MCRLLPLLLALTTAPLLYLSYFPVACGWLGWVALVPWLGLVRSPARPRWLYLLAWTSGLLFFYPALQWMRVADPRMYASWILVSLYCACYVPLALYLLRWLDQRTPLPLTLTLPVVWTALEFLRAHLMSGFPWYFLAHTQHTFLPLIQVADITGAYGVTFLVAAANALLFEMLWQRDAFRRWYGPRLPPRQSRVALLAQGLGLLMVFCGVLAYGAWRLSQDTQTPGPRVALLQSNMPQKVRNESTAPPGPDQKSSAENAKMHYIRLCDLAQVFRPDLIVWPETSFPRDWWQLSADYKGQDMPVDWPDRLDSIALDCKAMNRRWPTPMLLGLNANVLQANNKESRYNSALLLGRNIGQIEGRYDKIHRVPFGEYVPLRDWIPFMNKLAPYDYDYEVTAGTEHPRLPLVSQDGRRYHFGATICYEDTDPVVGRPYGRAAGPTAVDFVVNISNDGWFDGTEEHEQHLAICRFRAVECRRAVARSVNLGVSAVVDSNGRVLRPQRLPEPDWLGLLATAPAGGGIAGLPWEKLLDYQVERQVWEIPPHADELPVGQWHQYKKVAGVLLASIPIDHRTSVYARAGDWLPWSCWGLLGLAAAWTRLCPVAWRQK